MAGELHVFDAHAKWISSGTKHYKVRKSHSKSRKGCKTCKLRRIKCDEAKPICISCQRKDMPCAYPDNVPPEPPPVAPLLWPGKKTPDVLARTGSWTSERDLSMLHHFVTCTGRSLFDPCALYGAQEIDIVPLANVHPHIMHAVVAAAALHLRATTAADHSYTDLEAHHWLSASASFRTALAGYSLSTNPDPLVTTCMLLNLLAFANIGPPATAFSTHRWPYTPTTPSSLRWLRIQLGLSPLLSGLSQHSQGNSIWLPLFLASGTAQLYDNRPGTSGIPPSYQSMFAITEGSVCEATGTQPAHPYLKLVRRMLTLRNLYSTVTDPAGHNANSIKYTQFMEAIDGAVVERMEAKDGRTLLLYAQCMGLLCAVEHWWSRPRAVSECWAVTSWLDGRYGGWLGPRGWLEFPAAACGYRLTWRESMGGTSEYITGGF